MRPFPRPVTAAAVLLLLPSLAVWFSGWAWRPPADSAWLRAQIALTDTAGFPWALATCAVFSAAIWWMHRARPRQACALAALCLAAVLAGQGAKAAIKNTVRDSRPYVDWLAARQGTSSDAFYEMTRGERAAWIRQTAADPAVPAPLREHWQRETGYSFPSGHTLFSATWTLLCVGLFRTRRHRAACAAVVLWGALTACSRMTLGMHWPWDLATGTVISWLLALAALRLAQNHLPPEERSGA
ncbi:phosphatase PAP2 family protein [Termitidicoccus mucosus]|uniref:Phosphatidic acid phosphatase type 2/haloperoxidase domain-containing protein n=1 Tax=Termitidicoccus mucosus TaxID=1184151 RepID=A0A178IAH5_9BACT|nr:hypothetical protein AW736_25390 [Opitutaceae bacterium TSB47]